MIFSKEHTGEFFQIEEVNFTNSNPLNHIGNYQSKHILTVFWFLDNHSTIEIDNEICHFNQNELLFLTDANYTKFLSSGKILLIQFNRAFYCVIEHDREVSCKGLLFYGAMSLPKIHLSNSQAKHLKNILKTAINEFSNVDQHQLLMLQILLKQFLIFCTRLYKKQNLTAGATATNIDAVKEFNYLVEMYFNKLYRVKDYAELMNISSKTLSNLFSKYSNKSPLQIINERKILEAKRLLCYEKLSVKEVSYMLGYSDIQSFSRAFKNYTLIAPNSFKNICTGNIVKH